MQLLEDMRWSQFEELSGLVMRRWVLMVRAWEKIANKGKEKDAELKQAKPKQGDEASKEGKGEGL